MEEFVYHGIITKEEDRYEAICLEMDAGTISRMSPEEAREDLKSSVECILGSPVGICKNSTKEIMEEYSNKLSEVLSSPERFPEFYQFKDVAVYAQ